MGEDGFGAVARGIVPPRQPALAFSFRHARLVAVYTAIATLEERTWRLTALRMP